MNKIKYDRSKKIFGLLFSLLCFLLNSVRANDVLAIRVGTLLKGNGEVLRNALILIRDGRIDYAGPAYPLAKGIETLEFQEGVATPGFIAANAYFRLPRETQEKELFSYEDYSNIKKFKVLGLNEERSESTPEMNLLFSIDPRADDFEKAWRSGVTCIYLAPGNLNVINGTGTVLKTRGNSPLEMLVKNQVQIKVTFGHEPAAGQGQRNPVGLRYRRPENRMGVTQIFRSALTNLQNKSLVPDFELNPQELLFRKVLKGEIPLRIRARSYLDIQAALRMMDEFGFRWILEEGVDAYKYMDQLKERNIPVIYGPVYRARGRADFNAEQDHYLAKTPVLLASRGVTFAFQNGNESPINGLRDEAIAAVGLGLDRNQALKALTLNAARILGIENRLGTIEMGKDADLLIFNGDPFEPSSRLTQVIINGRIQDPNQ